MEGENSPMDVHEARTTPIADEGVDNIGGVTTTSAEQLSAAVATDGENQVGGINERR